MKYKDNSPLQNHVLLVLLLPLLYLVFAPRAAEAQKKRTPVKPRQATKHAKPPSAEAARNAALLQAAAVGDSARAADLLSRGANANARRSDGQTPLMLAILSADSEKAQVLTSERGNLGLVQMLVRGGASIDARNKMGFTPLLFAALTGNEKIVAWLLEKGGKVNVASEEGFTPLMAASAMRHQEIVKLLVGRGAAVNARDKRGRSALIHSIVDPKTFNMEAMIPNADQTVFAYLIERGADIHMTGNLVTPLMVAAMIGDMDKARFLLEQGVDVNAVGQEGLTALLGASYAVKPSVIKLLLEKGADANSKLSDGTTALMIVAEKASYACVELLLKHQADVNASHPNGLTPLKMALQKKHTGIVNQLKAAGAKE
jgi:ankyrin repeat protein